MLFVQCPGSTYTGHRYQETPHKFILSGASTATITPMYKEKTAGGAPNCTGPFGWSATVITNGCDFFMHIEGKKPAPAVDTYLGSVDIFCLTGKEITVTLWTAESQHTAANSPFCILHIPPQAGLTGLEIGDTTNGTIDVFGTLEGLEVIRTEQAADPSPVLCKTGQTEVGEFDIDTVVTGKNEAGGATAISLSGS